MELIAAEVFPPGDFLKEELEARGWTQEDLAQIMESHPRLVSDLITGKRAITPETAKKLSAALGTSAELWLNLDSSYRLHRAGSPSSSVAKRAKLFTKAPVREMVRRGWIEGTTDPDILEQRLLSFFRINSLEEEPKLWRHAARKSSSHVDVSPSQWAWLFRARNLASCQQVARYSPKNLSSAFDRLRNLLSEPVESRHVSRILAEAGISMVVVEHLAGTRIDGAAFWMRDTPVVALSLRYDRIDYFWHTLLHELAHIKHGDARETDARTLDVDLLDSSPDRPEQEKRADEFAADFTVPSSDLRDFIRRTRPLYSRTKICGFAARLHVHPGIIVGQLQYRGEVSYAHSRPLLVRVRKHVISSCLTDGWGFMTPSEL